jgi:hypothetical protein
MPKSKVTIKRTEQWEWTATGYDKKGTGGSETTAELDLLRKVVKKLQKENKKMNHIVKMISVGGCPRSKEDREMIEALADEIIKG